MFKIFIVTLLVFGLAMAGLAFGILAGRRGSTVDDATGGEGSRECNTCGRPAGAVGCAYTVGSPEAEAGAHRG